MSDPRKTPRSLVSAAPWLRKRLPAGGAGRQVARLLEEAGLHTVCAEARCPNQPECHARGTATFLILGHRCTRNCLFCAISPGEPAPPRQDEPQAVAEASARLGLKYVVVTSVTRDDLPDGGAGHFARTILAVRSRLPRARIEVLTPDFQGDRAAIDTVLSAGPDVFDHNLETVERLYPAVRPPRAAGAAAPDYRRSLAVLSYAKTRAADQPRRLLVKSGLMLGLGETDGETRSALADLRSAGADVLTLGQYLAPSADHWPVARCVEPREFLRWEEEARALGFDSVLAGPFVRSSYHAETLFDPSPRR